jgi:short-subunit dehydrogenase
MSWALIAGGSKGIGYGIAEALSARHFDLVLVGRSQQDLETAKNLLSDRYHNKIEILSCDLFLEESTGFIYDFCKRNTIPVNILCIAAGMGGAGDFPDLPIDDLRRMIRMNLDLAVSLCQIFRPILQENAPSYILTVGSMASFAPFPLKNIYSATKVALLHFTYSIRQQFKRDNIKASCLCPGPVYTKPEIEQETKKRLEWLAKYMSVEQTKVGEIAIRGMLKGKAVIIPGTFPRIISFFLRIMPAGISSALIGKSRE